MRSIKNKLLTGIILINSIILIGICIFRFGFEDFYIKQTSRELSKFGKSVGDLISKGTEDDVINYIAKYVESKNVSIDIYDKDDLLILTNNYASMNRHNDNNVVNKHGMYKKNRFVITNEYRIDKTLNSYIILDKVQRIDFLASIIQSNNNMYSIVCKTPISAIKNSVDTAFKFLFVIFAPIIALSIFMAIWFSNKFTKPIIHLTCISNKISNLDFDEKVHIYTNDEIEVLGNSINTLSSKIKNTMNDLKAKNEELEILINNKIKQEKLKKEFVSSVSHELKTPITVINGYAEGLRSDILDSEEDKQYYIDIICEESEKMGIIVNDLLELYKLESNTFKIVKDKVNIEDLIKNVVKKHEIILKEKEININLDLQKAYILGDKIRLEQVLNNLLDNAINHIDEKKQMKISTKLINENIHISIYNSGKIINENNLEKIWHSFVRLDKVRNSNDNRIGLGLAIVREIMNLHDGICGVENKKDGVEFWIKF